MFLFFHRDGNPEKIEELSAKELSLDGNWVLQGGLQLFIVIFLLRVYIFTVQLDHILSYAWRKSPSYEDYKALVSSNRSRSKSSSPVNSGKITYITSFGGDEPSAPVSHASKWAISLHCLILLFTKTEIVFLCMCAMSFVNCLIWVTRGKLYACI